MREQVTLTREQLYELVWMEPISRLAKRYGLTDGQWRQQCIRMSIPLPRREHWPKVRMGIAIERPPLPKHFTGRGTVTLTTTAAPSSKRAGHPSTDPIIAPPPKSEKADRPARRESEDPLVTGARHQLQHADKRWLDNGLVWTKGKYFRIGVAPPNIERACRFVNAFLRAVHRRGYRITVDDKDTILHIGYQPLPILVRERTKRISEVNRRNSWATSHLEPGGELYFHLTYQFKEREWRIGDGDFPEETERVVDLLEAASERIDTYYRELEAGWARMREEERIQQERKARRESELKGFKHLLQSATRWQQAEWIRNYLSAMEQRETAVSGYLPPDRATWFAWARAKADWYDPLLETPDEWLSNVTRDTLP